MCLRTEDDNGVGREGVGGTISRTLRRSGGKLAKTVSSGGFWGDIYAAVGYIRLIKKL